MKKITYFILFMIIIIIQFSNNIYHINSKNVISIKSISNLSYLSQTSEPKINAKHGIVLDRNSKTYIFGKKENEKCKMASTTKIMTAIIVIENSNLDGIVKISANSASTGGSRLGLSKNNSISVRDLLYGLLLKSGNDAAVALAEYTGGSVEGFAILMNEKSKSLNLKNTHFVTPHGLDNENHYSTAYDLAILSDYALKNDIFSKIVKTKHYTIHINNHPKIISNTNELLGYYSGIYGVKTGFTNGANRCLITSCKRGNLDFICVVLGCDTKKDRTQDSTKLLDYAFNNYSLVNVEKYIEGEFNNWYDIHKGSFNIDKGINNHLELSLDKEDLVFSNIAVHNNHKDSIYVEIQFNSCFSAPLYQNTKIGKISLYIDTIEYYSIDILSKNEIPKKSFLDYFIYFLRNYSSLIHKDCTI